MVHAREVLDDAGQLQGGTGIEHRDLDVLPLSGALALVQPEERGFGEQVAGDRVDLRRVAIALVRATHEHPASTTAR